MLHRVKTSMTMFGICIKITPTTTSNSFIFNIITHYIPGNTRIPLTYKIRQNCQGFQ